MISMNDPIHLSKVESQFADMSAREMIYPGEYIPALETINPAELGKLTALRFLEWVIENPTGVIALPTGKTPEFFIKYLVYYRQFWQRPVVRDELAGYGFLQDHFPDTTALKFVQIDEFYPIKTVQANSFNYYIRHYYLNILKVNSENCLLMDTARIGILKDHSIKIVFPHGKVDLGLRNRRPITDLENIQKHAILEADRYCDLYESKIEAWGGIGFFLGGIGPDGHIAFNIRGSAFESKTRLLKLNYESAAAAAIDLGGIENSRDKAVITIGLQTITARPDAVIIILAAGAAKAQLVADAMEKPASTDRPVSVLHGVKGAKFYLTSSAAGQLKARRRSISSSSEKIIAVDGEYSNSIINLAIELGKPIKALTPNELLHAVETSLHFFQVNNEISFDTLIIRAQESLLGKLRKGLARTQQQTILHTAPHHDDIMLSYLPIIKQLLPANDNHVAYLTSGFTAVSNAYIKEMMALDHSRFLKSDLDIVFKSSEQELLISFRDAYFKADKPQMRRIEHIIFLKLFGFVFNVESRLDMLTKLRWLSHYLWRTYPGQKDIAAMQLFKGLLRESESNRKWSILGLAAERVRHLRLKFYTGDFFTPVPTIQNDALPVLNLLKEVDPDILTVAFDPEGSGPDTHYKVLQIIAQALRLDNSFSRLIIWGYRNVWHRFDINETNMIIPVYTKDQDELASLFQGCFSTQSKASFPSPYFDGPFSGLAVQIQKEQLAQVKLLLGDLTEYRELAALEQAAGLIFLKQMDLQEFLQSARELKSSTENG